MKPIYVADDGTQFDSERECLEYEASPKIYYIKNTVNEISSEITRYCSSLEEAKRQLQHCCDWYADKGTGQIYEVRCNAEPKPKLVYEVTQSDLLNRRYT